MPRLKMALPKGRIADEVVGLLGSAGLAVRTDGRDYRPVVSDPDIETKFLKPQNIPRLVEIGAHDCGFTGHDWVEESAADVVEVFDTGLDPVTLVAAAPEEGTDRRAPPRRPLIVASEFERITRRYMASRRETYLFIRTYGASEVFPPEDADLILDLIATGATLRANRLVVVAEVLRSSTRLVAGKTALADPWKAAKIEALTMLLASVLEGRRRVLLEMNVTPDRLAEVIGVLPAMKAPTVQELHGAVGFAVKAAVLRERLPEVIVRLRRAGATDLLAYALEKVIP